MSSINSTIDYLRDITDDIRFIFGLFNMILGLISNISLIIILTNVKIFRKSPSSLYLIIESYFNIGLLIFICSSRLLTNILKFDPTLTSIAWCKIRSGFSQFFGLCSLFTICFTTIDQYLSTNPRYYLRQLSTMKSVYYFLIFNLGLSFSHGILFVIYAEIRQFSLGCTIYDERIKKYFSYFYYPILSNAFPLLITMTFSFLSYVNVRRIIRRQTRLIRRRLDQQLTAMILIRILSLIIFGFPYIIITLYQLNLHVNENNDIKSTITLLIGSIFYSLLYMNFSINFYLFLIISSRFRRQVKHYLKMLCLSKHINQITPQMNLFVESV